MQPVSIMQAIAAVLVLAAPLAAQPIFLTTPDWSSTDTPYSTGGAFVDLNHDGWLDFVVSNGNDMRQERVAVYLNDAAGGFPGAPSWQSADLAYNGHLAVADVNGDGWDDVAVAHLGNSSTFRPIAKLYLNNNGTLALAAAWSANVSGNAFGVAFGDMNGDGRPDLAVGTGWSYNPQHYYHNYVYLNVDGALSTTPSWTSADTYHYQGVLWVDADSDGWLDLVGVASRTDTRLYRNLGGTLETTASWRTTDGPNQDAIMATAGDVNGDGLLDLLLTDNIQLDGSGRFKQYSGLVSGYFSSTYSWSYLEDYGSAVALADVDADGDLDLATGGWWDNTRLFYNTGSGLPVAPGWNSAGTSVVEKIVFGDVDNDGQRYPTETFTVAEGTAGRLLYLHRQPIERIDAVLVDGVLLQPDQYTAGREHGWVSLGVDPLVEVTVRYTFSLKPDMGITNWDDDKPNYLYYNRNSSRRCGDLNGDETVDLDDLAGFADCVTGPAGGLLPGCGPADADLDDDVDLDDVAWLQRLFEGS